MRDDPDVMVIGSQNELGKHLFWSVARCCYRHLQQVKSSKFGATGEHESVSKELIRVI